MKSKFQQAEEQFFDAIRSELASEVLQLSDDQQRIFRLMYGRDMGKRSVTDTEAMPIESVVSEIPEDKLDWAMQQVENSRAKMRRSSEELAPDI